MNFSDEIAYENCEKRFGCWSALLLAAPRLNAGVLYCRIHTSYQPTRPRSNGRVEDTQFEPFLAKLKLVYWDSTWSAEHDVSKGHKTQEQTRLRKAPDDWLWQKETPLFCTFAIILEMKGVSSVGYTLDHHCVSLRR